MEEPIVSHSPPKEFVAISHSPPKEFVSVSHAPEAFSVVVPASLSAPSEVAPKPARKPMIVPTEASQPAEVEQPKMKNKAVNTDTVVSALKAAKPVIKPVESPPITPKVTVAKAVAPEPEAEVTCVTENTTNLTEKANNTKKCGCKYDTKSDNPLKVGYSQQGLTNMATVIPLDTNSAEHMQIQHGVSQASRDVLQTGCHIGETVAEASRNILMNDAAGTSSIIADNQRVAFANQDHTDKVGVATRDAVERNGSLNLTSTERNGGEIRYNLERSAGDTRWTVERTAAETRSLVHDNYAGIMMANKDNLLAAKDTQIDVERARCASREATLHLHRSLGKTEARLGLQAEKHHGVERLDLCHVEGRLQRQASDNYAAIQLDALKNKEALARQMSECCCELKERVANTAAATQALIRDTETARLRDSLATASQENLILRLRGALPTLPV